MLNHFSPSLKPPFILSLTLIILVISLSGVQPARAESRKILTADFSKGADYMITEELAFMGEILIFGRVVNGDPEDSDVGRAQCPLCHIVTGNVGRDRAPSLKPDEEQTGVPIGLRGEIRIKEPRYQMAEFAQRESHPGSGRATTNIEYIAESTVCPQCYVVRGFGIRGSDDLKSPDPKFHLPPTSINIEEFIAIDTYVYVKDGLEPPSPSEIRAAYLKFIPLEERRELFTTRQYRYRE